MKFKFSEKFQIDTSQEPYKTEGLRVGWYGAPGSGKSYGVAACLIEPLLEQGGTVVVFEPRAEWETLREKFQVVVAGGPFKDIPIVTSQPKLYADAVVNNGVSIIFNTGDIEDEEKLVQFVERFLGHLLRLEEKVRRPIFLVLEETQNYAPLSARGHIAPPWVYSRMIRQFKECFAQGRKLGISPIAISQRPQEINFTIRMLALISLYGKFAPQDIQYIDRECLKPYKQRGLKIESNQLLDLEKGTWLLISGSEAEITHFTAKRECSHFADTPKFDYVPPLMEEVQTTVNDLAKTLEKALEKERLEESKLEKAQRKIRQLEKQITEGDKELERLRTALEVAGKIKIELPAAPGQPIVIPKQTLPAPKMDVPFLNKRRSVPDAMRELLQTKYCHQHMGLTPNEVKDVLKKNAIPHTDKQVNSWLWAQARAGELRRRPEGRTYRYWKPN